MSDGHYLLLVFVGWFGFYGISTFVGYLTPNPFLCKWSVLFQTIQFSMITQFNSQKYFYFKLFSLFKQLYMTIQFSVSTVSMSKIVQFKTIHFSKNTQFKCKYSLIVKNISISSYSLLLVRKYCKDNNNNNNNNNKTSIRPYKQMVYAQPGAYPRKWLA